jgi:hypothetical protein
MDRNCFLVSSVSLSKSRNLLLGLNGKPSVSMLEAPTDSATRLGLAGGCLGRWMCTRSNRKEHKMFLFDRIGSEASICPLWGSAGIALRLGTPKFRCQTGAILVSTLFHSFTSITRVQIPLGTPMKSNHFCCWIVSILDLTATFDSHRALNH